MIDHHRDQNYYAVNHTLHVCFHAGEIHAVADDADDQGPDQGADDFALSSSQTGSADDDGGNDLQSDQCAALGITGDVQGRLHHPAQSGQQRAHGVNKYEHPLHRHARKPGSLGIATNGVNVTTN